MLFTHLIPHPPLWVSPRAPITTSKATSTPVYLPSTKLFTSPSYTLSSSTRTPYSGSVSQPGQSRTVEDSHASQDIGVGGHGGGVLFSHPLNVVVQGGDGEKRQQLVVTVSTTPVSGTQAKSISIAITNK